MKKLLFSAGIFAISALAHAEVKPWNAVLEIFCGHINRGVEICVAGANSQEGHQYLVIKQHSRPNRYVLVEADRRGRVGATTTVYTGYGVEAGDSDMLEREYELTVVETVIPERPLKGTYKIDGKIEKSNFTMNWMLHTE